MIRDAVPFRVVDGIAVLDFSGDDARERYDLLLVTSCALAFEDGTVRRVEAAIAATDTVRRRALHRAGFRLELSPHFVESTMKGSETVSEVLVRQLRWGRTMRVSRPGGYLASGITLPFPGALLALVLSGFSREGLAAAALLYLVRSAVSLSYSRAYLKDRLLPRWLWLLPVRDALSFGVWALSLFGNRVVWRGHLFSLAKGGKIVEIGSPTP